MPENSPSLTYITRCLFCDFEIASPGFESVDINNLNPQQTARVSEFHMQLLAHMQRGAQAEEKQITRLFRRHKENGGPPPDTSKAKHFALWQTFLTRTMLAQSSAILSGFSSDDPSLNALREAGRWKLHEVTRRTYFTDAMLLDALVPFELEETQQAKILELIIEIRDALLEQGKYEPRPGEAPAPSRLIVTATH